MNSVSSTSVTLPPILRHRDLNSHLARAGNSDQALSLNQSDRCYRIRIDMHVFVKLCGEVDGDCVYRWVYIQWIIAKLKFQNTYIYTYRSGATSIENCAILSLNQNTV